MYSMCLRYSRPYNAYPPLFSSDLHRQWIQGGGLCENFVQVKGSQIINRKGKPSSGRVCKMMIAYMWIAGYTAVMLTKVSTPSTIKHRYSQDGPKKRTILSLKQTQAVFIFTSKKKKILISKNALIHKLSIVISLLVFLHRKLLTVKSCGACYVFYVTLFKKRKYEKRTI